MQSEAITLEVIALGSEDEAAGLLALGALGAEAAAARRANLDALHGLLAEVGGQVRVAGRGEEVLQLFKSKEVQAQALYRGPLTLAPGMELQVRTVLRVCCTALRCTVLCAVEFLYYMPVAQCTAALCCRRSSTRQTFPRGAWTLA